ncbi:MAG TPA: hypothetical protein VLB27_00905, partial [candidate division Zixibacteria bacterium]|nr:hypothetical protein [candidate division Zixibacteria bacterium]
MKKQPLKITAIAILGLGFWAGCGSAESDGPTSIRYNLDELEENCDQAEDIAVKAHKVAICHIPPGNPDNAHTIVVSVRAKDAHLAHGDTLGG